MWVCIAAVILVAILFFSAKREGLVPSGMYEGQTFECTSNLGSFKSGGAYRYTKNSAGQQVGSWYPSPTIAATWTPNWNIGSNRQNADCTGIEKGPNLSEHIDPPGWVKETNTDYAGFDIRQITKSTPDACFTACTNDPTCKGFGFDNRLTNGNPNNVCFLKNSMAQKKSVLTSFDSYTKPVPTPAPAGWLLEADSNYASNGFLPASTATTAAACNTACDASTNCKGTVFDTVANKCYLKQAMATKSTLGGFHSYTKPEPAPTGWTLEVNSDYVGNPLGSEIKDSTAAACNTACASTIGCKGSVFNISSKTCYLKAALPTKSTSVGLNSYKKPEPTKPSGWTLEVDSNYALNDIMPASTATTAAACNTACTTNPACKGTVFDTIVNKCYLKNAMTTKSSLGGFNSYTKPAPTPAPEGWTLEADSTYAGTDLRVSTAPDAANCNVECAANPDCKGTVFDYTKTSNKCTLKQTMGTKSAFSGADSYTKPAVPPTPALAGFTLEADSRYGGTFSEKGGSTATDCMTSCGTTAGCLGIGMDSSSVCRQYTAFSDPKSTVVGYNTYKSINPLKIPTPAQTGWTLEANTKYEGTYTTTTNSTDCISSCGTTDGCLGVGIDANNDCRKYTAFSDTKSTVVGYNTYKNGTPYETPVDAPVAAVDAPVAAVDGLIDGEPFVKDVDVAVAKSVGTAEPVAYNEVFSGIDF